MANGTKSTKTQELTPQDWAKATREILSLSAEVVKSQPKTKAAKAKK